MRSIPSTSAFLHVLLALCVLIFTAAHSVYAQLRPLDPTDFRALDGARVRVQFGSAIYLQQYASLTGARGRLVEVGDMRTSWRSGRFVVEVSGTVQRIFREDTLLQAPVEGVAASTVQRTRRDAGDYRVQTILRLTNDTAATSATLRFGTRLPTTDNRVGLERDQTDFFATLGGLRSFGPLQLMAEAGISINGTRLSNYEQSDVLIYAASLERRGRLFSPYLTVVGQNDLHVRSVRGNEDLGELRAGLHAGNRKWINAQIVRGFHDASPRLGFSLNAGFALGY